MYKEKAQAARKRVLEMIHRAKTSHIGSNFSVIDIATVLYDKLGESDDVVWSKGWAACTAYYFLAQRGKIPQEDLDKFPNEPYLGLTELGVPGINITAGSVGQGLACAAGMAHAEKLSGNLGTMYCIMSDGELDAGLVWEAVRIAAKLKLNNLIAIIDNNGWQAMDRTKDVQGGDIAEAFKGHGWATLEIDGHNYDHIARAIDVRHESKPLVIIANTVKCKGIPSLEDKLESHYQHVTDEIYQEALKNI